jgi:ComEC/Rec2-related protein
MAQHGALLFAPSYTAVCLIVLLLVCGFWQRWSFVLLSGLLTALPLLVPGKQIPPGEYQVVMQLEGEPYYGRNEEVSFNGLTLTEGASRGGKEALPAGSRVLCQSPLLPWRNSSLLHSARQVGALISVAPVKASPPWSRDAQMRRTGIDARCKVKLLTRPLLKEPVSLRTKLINHLRAKLGDTEALSLVLGMTIGLRGAVSRRTERAFRTLTLSHLLVVSGYHFGVVFSLLSTLFWFPKRLFPAQKRLLVGRCCSLLVVLALVFYCWFIDGALSSSRALLAAAIAYAGINSERGVSFFNSVLFAAVVLCAVYPGSLFNIGMQYTFAALTGIGVALAGSKKRWQLFLQVPVYATLASSCITLLWFQSFSVFGLFANVLLAPLFAVSIVTPGLLALLLLPTSEWLALSLLQIVSFIAYHLRDLVWYCATLPGADFEVPGLLGVFLSGVFLFAVAAKVQRQLRRYLQWRAVFPYKSIYAMQRTFIDL